MNNTDRQYHELLEDILKNGYQSEDRTGTGTISVFCRELRFKMSEGLPAVTTKKLFFKGIIHELLFFLGNHVNPASSTSTPEYIKLGGNNIKYLVDNGVNIWVGDCYKRYTTPSLWLKPRVVPDGGYPKLTKDEFTHLIKTDFEFAKEWGDIGPGYGQQWRGWKTGKNIVLAMKTFENGTFKEYGEVVIDQVAQLIDKLKTKPTDRRLMVSAWNVADVPDTLLPPCHYGYTCYTRVLTDEEREILAHRKKYGGAMHKDIGVKMEDAVKLFENDFNLNLSPSEEELESIPTRALSLKWNQRSVDTPLGLPFNILSYAILLEMLAKEANMVAEELIGSLENTHIYLNQLDGVQEQLHRISYHGSPRLWLNPEKSIFEYSYEDIKVLNYKSQGKIDFPLSN